MYTAFRGGSRNSEGGVIVSNERALVSSSTTEIPSPPGARQKLTSDPKQSTLSTISTNQPSTRDGITSSSPGVAMETESLGEEPKVVGSKESRTVFVSNLIMATTYRGPTQGQVLRGKRMYICVRNFAHEALVL